MKTSRITNVEHALVEALYLAITATTETKAAECTAIAERLARGMAEKTVQKCMQRAQRRVRSAS